ncbi:DUF928 domain-containing protein [Microcoleus sp. Pol11C3]|uniref:DUF928 domain-containing protein n=1 Tax=Microcoleus sp. Pol11C3 TaxID=3055390 RepID=UPI002FD11F56
MKLMKIITKFILNLTSVGSIVLIATLNTSQFAVMGQRTPGLPQGKPGTGSGGPRYGPRTPGLPQGKPATESGGPRFVQPREDMDDPLLQTPKSVRGGCGSIRQLGLTALVPKNKIGRTVSDYPTFLFYLPQTEAELAEFTLNDQSGNQIYKQDVKISNLSGVIGVSIPANKNVPPLEVGKSYTWKFSVVCDAQDRSSDQLESGKVRRVELNADIRRQLDQAAPRQKTVIYAENGIWQDALSTLAAARSANPNDAELVADWESLLGSVQLSEIAKEPIVPIDPQP